MKFPYAAFFALGSVCVLGFACIIRIWERPYFELTLDPPGLDFTYIGSAVWYILISMTTVGYGNIVASTPVGRALAITAIIVGAFLLSLLVGLILAWFELESDKEDAITTIEESFLAVKLVRAGLTLNIALKKRKRFVR